MFCNFFNTIFNPAKSQYCSDHSKILFASKYSPNFIDPRHLNPPMAQKEKKREKKKEKGSQETPYPFQQNQSHVIIKVACYKNVRIWTIITMKRSFNKNNKEILKKDRVLERKLKRVLHRFIFTKKIINNMSNIVVEKLSAFLAKIIKDYSKKQLDVSLLKGSVQLKDFGKEDRCERSEHVYGDIFSIFGSGKIEDIRRDTAVAKLRVDKEERDASEDRASRNGMFSEGFFEAP
ncbi:hypothetical protein RFI_10900 [Reticulomyxa filosa]|uniref:Uncharacterized protein n=1 Tax=Reticulomyxa filosa TaxID=46433 RepID=X6NJT2_RETFI|nr:hypothetical protein RFI_10900 [Reticulomyxa filosa]|eukprot:ETO26241.1 hypothetical protein RFI_10900 [Reticulomyxa filosa]